MFLKLTHPDKSLWISVLKLPSHPLSGWVGGGGGRRRSDVFEKFKNSSVSLTPSLEQCSSHPAAMGKIDLVIDVQGFHDKHADFLPKEIAVVGVDCNYLSHWIIKYNIKEHNIGELSTGILATNTYLTCHHHGIECFDGEADLNAVYSALQQVARNALRIYVRGFQKQELLQRLLGRQVINLEDYRCPSFKNLPRDHERFCNYHGGKREYFACSLAYAYKLRNWLRKSLTFTTAPGKDEVDVQQQEQQQQQQQNNEKKIVDLNSLCEQLKKIECRRRTPARGPTAPTPPPRSDGGDTEPLYDNVSQNELAPDSKSACTRSGSNRGGVSCRQDSGAVEETLCPCS